MKNIIAILLVSLFFIACSEKDNIKSKPWSIYVYMAADNNLSERAYEDINQMELASFDSLNVNVVVQADFFDDTAKRFKITNDDDIYSVSSPIIQNLGEIDSGSPNSISSFINWAKKNYPGEKTMFVIWSHGNGWRNKSVFFCPDRESNSYISILNGELKKALSGHRFDILAFDACSMQAAEVISICKNNASYIVASEDEVPTKGFAYYDMLGQLNKNTTAYDFSIILAESYKQSLMPGGSQNPTGQPYKLTISAVDTKKFKAFENSFANFTEKYANTANSEIFKTTRQSLFKLNSTVFDSQLDTDLRQFLYKLNQNATGSLKTDAATNLELIEDSFIYADSYNIGTNEVDYCTVWFADTLAELEAYKQVYPNLGFAKNKWLEFLVNFNNGE